MVAAAMLLAIGAGCDKVTGGGWIASSSLDPTEKATFGFSAKCRTTTVDSIPFAVFYEGQLEYEDHGVDIRIHGDVEPHAFAQSPGTCRDAHEFAFSTTFEGTYRSQPDGAQGHFTVIVTDNGEPGHDGDTFCITLTVAINYPMHCAPVQGGNIQID